MIASKLPGIAGNRALYLGIVIVAFIVGGCLIVPWISSYESNELVGSPYQSPSSDHFFGTDGAGRDVFLRTFQGGRLNLGIAAVTVVLSCAIGTVIGAISGASGSRTLDGILMRCVDAVIAIPFVVFILALIAVIGETRKLFGLPPGAGSLCIAIVAVNWVVYARLARAKASTLRERDFVHAARLLGYSRRRIIGRHILPSVWRTTMTFAVADAVLMVVVTAGLAFVGAGIQPPTADWGSMMYEGRGVLKSAWWITLMPGLLIVVTGLGVSLIADALIARRKVSA